MYKFFHFLNSKFKIGLALLLLLIGLIITDTSTLAQESDQVVRVGFFELPGFNEYNKFGNPTGYNIEYLDQIAEHTGWKYEYVKANSWPEALELLENNEIDILSPSQQTDERKEKFNFTDYSFGTEYGSILTLGTNYDLSYEDFDEFSKIKFGCVNSLVFKEDFFTYAQSNGFTPNMTYYKDTNALLAALNLGEVDAVVANLMQAKGNMKVLARFAPGSFYYMLNKQDTSLFNQMNETMSHMKIVHSELESELAEKYFPFYKSVSFTKQELEYIADAPELSVGYISYQDPISFVNSKTGEFDGITKDILERISSISGLKFKYCPLPTGDITYDYLRDNHIQLASNIEYNSINVSVPNLKLTYPYISTWKVAVGKQGTSISNNKSLKVALIKGSQTLESVVKASYPNAKILFYDTLDKCFNAVLSGDTDILIQNQYVVERYLPKPKYENLAVIPTEGIVDELSISPIMSTTGNSPEDKLLSDERLISILNKSIAFLTQKEVSNIIIQQTTSRPYQFTIGDSLYKYRHFIIALIFTLLLACLAGVYAYVQKSKNTRILQSSEANLRNIANNINGGVVVLLPNKGLKITYANEGFLSLIQYSLEEYELLQESDYITYVHPDDIATLNDIIDQKFDVGEHISIRLRLLRKDGTFLPTLFSGTLTESHSKQKELYCVIMDLSEQTKIMNQLEEEQARYQLLIDKSDDMIFDINMETKEIIITKKFKAKFGWTLPKYCDSYTVEQMISLWHIHENDITVFTKSLTELLLEAHDTECIVRVMKKDLTCRWCNIAHNIMKKNGTGIRIIGKVTDIDDEIKEKERLFKQTQIDSLSGLYNKKAFYTLGTEYFREHRYENSAVVFIDLDNFKQINDLLGHMAGDQAIKDAAKKLQIIFSQYDLLSRFGGDEFCLLIKEIPIEALRDKLNWTLEKMNTNYRDETHTITITASIGVALAPLHGTEISQLLQCSDQALYSAKENGKNQYVIYNEGLRLDGYQGRP